MFEIDKTILVLDYLPYFLESSEQMIDFEIHTKQKGPSSYQVPPISKSMWTCAIESALEYARIVFDIFPNKKLIQIVINGKSTSSINSWNINEQTFQFLTNTLAHFPFSNFMASQGTLVERCFTNGYKKALELLSMPTKCQKEKLNNGKNTKNYGRVIYLTSIKKKEDFYKFETISNEFIDLQNKFSENTDNLLKIDGISLNIVNMHPVGNCDNSIVIDSKEVSPVLYSELHNSQSGKFLALKMVELAIKHCNLSSTTVTGIPMKEEQNAQSSANYDVELLHDRNVYIDLIKMGYLEELSTPSKELLHSQTVILKWCTPKTISTEMHHCSSAFRITPVDVISRPSSCLINFLLGGRSVMLEQQRKSGVKVTSHVLTSHGQEVFIHTLAMANCKRSPLEDPVSISEGVGGRITDYRINDFCQLIKENLLAPSLDYVHGVEPLDSAKARLQRVTKYWPMLISETVIFNITHITGPLIFAVLKPEVTPAEVLECSKVIHQLLTMESKNEALLVTPNAGSRLKASKREGQYHRMWLELEKFIRVHQETSPGHLKILDCLLENGRAQITEDERNKKPPADIKKPEETSVEIAPDVKRRRKENEDLLTVWLDLLKSNQSKRKEEFHGRQEAVNGKTQLYKHLTQKDNSVAIMET